MSSTSIDGLLKLLREIPTEMPTSGPGASTASLEVAAPMAMGDAILGAIYKKMDRPVTGATMRPSAVSKPSAPKAMGDAILGAVYKKMDRPVTRATMRPSAVSKPSAAVTEKKIIICKVAVIMELSESEPVLFYIGRNSKKLDNFIEGKSSGIIKIKKRNSKVIQCETRSSIYRIPKDKLHDGTTLIKEFLRKSI